MEQPSPWDAQAAVLIRLSDAQSEVAAARKLTSHFLPPHPAKDLLHGQAEAADAQILDPQRVLVRRRLFHFEVRPAAKKPP